MFNRKLNCRLELWREKGDRDRNWSEIRALMVPEAWESSQSPAENRDSERRGQAATGAEEHPYWGDGERDRSS